MCAGRGWRRGERSDILKDEVVNVLEMVAKPWGVTVSLNMLF